MAMHDMRFIFPEDSVDFKYADKDTFFTRVRDPANPDTLITQIILERRSQGIEQNKRQIESFFIQTFGDPFKMERFVNILNNIHDFNFHFITAV